MKREVRNNVYKRFSQVMVSALTGQARVSVTIAVYSVIALLLLSYVSAQIYAGLLMQEIAELKQVRSDLNEDVNKLTSDYVSLSSRSRVSRYCEDRLGMVEAAAGESLEILAVKNAEGELAIPVELTKKQPVIPSAYRYTLRPTKERPGQ
ncbi:MAG: hypothetical protein JSW58_13685 [Candidatus Latescibacterota bacterium]|nr:MAG: hypothetical protein JSW58_13685 [Candidatus Latescibacterota bacterium]